MGIYAATSSISVTLALAAMTWVFTHIEGIRYNGVWRYLKSWIPEVPKAILPLIIVIEVFSQFMRLISLSVRLFANMLAGHILILTMIGLIFIIHSWPWRALRAAGGVPLLRLRGRDRRHDPGLHLRRPLGDLHRHGDRARALAPIALPTNTKENHRDDQSPRTLRLELTGRARRQGDRARAGIGLGAAGAGAGIGIIFGSMIQSVARQPELRGELQGLMWLGFALTEAVVFYGFLGGLLGYVLV